MGGAGGRWRDWNDTNPVYSYMKYSKKIEMNSTGSEFSKSNEKISIEQGKNDFASCEFT